MTASVESVIREGIEVWRLLGGEGTWAEVVPAWGDAAIAFEWRGEPVLERVDFATVAAKPTSYGIPILFPFPNRIRDGVFPWDGETYAVDPPRHGFVRDKPWALVEATAEGDEAWVTARFDAAVHPERVLAQFPFPFVLEVTHRLGPNGLTLEAMARNVGDRDLPAGFGIHPYFHAPEGGRVMVPARKRWALEATLPTGERVDVEAANDLREPRDLAGLELDDVYTDLVLGEDGRVECRIEDPRGARAIVIGFDGRNLPEAVVYTPPAPRVAVCVEPQSCPTDAFNLAARGIDAHVRRLAPGGEARWTIDVRVEKG